MNNKPIADLLVVKQYLLQMHFGVSDVHNFACAKSAVDYIDKAVEQYKADNEVVGDGNS